MEPFALHSLHEAQGARFETLEGRELVRAFASGTAAEVAAARAGSGLYDLSARELLRVSGDDRDSFLHGMVTNEVKALPEDGVTYAALLTPKGAMVSDARIWRERSSLLVEAEPGRGEPVRAFLEKYLISEDVELRPCSELALLALSGPRTAAVLSEVWGLASGPAEGRSARVGVEGVECRVGPSHLAGVPGADLLVPRAGLEAVYRRLTLAGATPVGFDAWEVLRVEAGVPRFGADLEETTIPLEARLERAISYQKGCYIGQEVIARATFRGHVNRLLCGLLLGEAAPSRHAELRKEDRKVGFVTSVVASPTLGQHIGLGYVHRDHVTPGTKLLVEGKSATVCELPFGGR